MTGKYSLEYLGLDKCCDAPDIETGWRPEINRYIECRNCKMTAIGDSHLQAMSRWNIHILRNGPMVNDNQVELLCMELMSG
jgi:hypothetical protein